MYKVLTRDHGAISISADNYVIDDEKVLRLRTGSGDVAAFREWIGVIPSASGEESNG